MAGVFGALARAATDIARSADEAVRLVPEAVPVARQAVKEVRPITTSPIRPVAAKPAQAGSTPKGIDISNTSGLDEEMDAMLGGAPAPSSAGTEMSDDLAEMFKLAEETLALPDAVPESNLASLFKSQPVDPEVAADERSTLPAGQVLPVYKAAVESARDMAKQLLNSESDEDAKLIANFYLGDTDPLLSSGPTDKYNVIRNLAESNIRAGKWLKETYMKDVDFDSKFKMSDGTPLVFWRAIRTQGNMEDAPIKSGYDVFSQKIESPDEIGSHAGSFDQAYDFYGPTAQAGDELTTYERATKSLRSLNADSAMLRQLAKNGQLEPEATARAASIIDTVAEIVSDSISPFAQLQQATKADSKGIGLSMDRDTANTVLDGIDELRRMLLEAAPTAESKQGVERIIRQQKEAMIKVYRQVADAASAYSDTRPATTSVMAPMLLRSKKPFEMVDNGVNDARNWVTTADMNRADLNPEETRLLDMMLDKPYYTKGEYSLYFEGDMDVLAQHDKDFQNALKELGYDSIVYTNTAEGIGSKKSIIVFDKEQVVTMEQLVPELKAMSKKEQRMVYSMMATGVGLQQAISIVMDDGGDA